MNGPTVKICERCKKWREHGVELRTVESFRAGVCVRLDFAEICDPCIQQISETTFAAAFKTRVKP